MKEIMCKAKEFGMFVLYNDSKKYVLTARYHDSQSGKVCGTKHSLSGEFRDGFPKFKRFFFDFTFDKILLLYCRMVRNFIAPVHCSFVSDSTIWYINTCRKMK